MLPISADRALITSYVAVACLRSYSASYDLEKLESTGLIWGEISDMKYHRSSQIDPTRSV